LKNTGDIRIDKLMPRLHEAWPILPFEECLVPCNIRYRKLKTTEIKPSGMIPVIDQGESLISGYTDEPANEYPGPLPIIIFGDHTRRFKFVDFKFAVGAEGTHLLYPFGALESKFFYYYLSALSLESQGYSRHYKFLKEALVPVPPLGEQRRIVAKLEKLLDKLDACQKRLAKIPILLKRFRQSVLAAASSGRLTEDWRDKATEETLEVAELANPKAAVQVEEIVDTPNCWRWLPLHVLCDPSRAICYGVIKLGVEHPGGIPCLRTSDVKPLRIDTADVKCIAPEVSNEYQRTLLRGGEVLVNVRGTLGGVAVVPQELRNWNISREVALVPIAGVLPKFVAFWVASSPCQNWLTGVAKGVAYTGINIEDLRLLPIALPPLAEQQEIVRRVEALFVLADNIEQRYKKAQAFIDKLTPSLLAKAFRGELVPQNPNDEPASVLLERIKAEKEKENKVSGKGVRGHHSNREVIKK